MAKRKEKEATTRRDETLENLLVQVPNHAFNAMIMASGMPRDDAQRLFEKFKELKG